MILESLVFCSLLAVIVWLAFRANSLFVIVGTFVCAGMFLVLSSAVFFSSAVYFFNGSIAVFPLLIAAVTLARRVKLSPRWFAGWCAGVIVATFGVMMLRYIPIYQEHQRMLAKYPVVDLSPRLSYENARVKSSHGALGAGQPGVSTLSFSSPESSPLKDLETKIEMSKFYGETRYRDRALRAMSIIHVGFVQDFVDQPGFGYRRTLIMPLREHHVTIPEIVPIPQPATPPSPPISTPSEIANNDFAQAPPLPQPDAGHPAERGIPLPEFNAQQVANFASGNTLGFVVEKRQARGFLPHAFRKTPDELKIPESTAQWKLARLQLVSLLRHQPGAAYLSENLPAMDELKDAPTRPLDEFEMQAVAAIRGGEEIVVESTLNGKRMVGSIRAAKQCMECHEVERGELLGAFTYRFYRDPLLPEPAEKAPGKRVAGIDTGLRTARASR